LQRTRFNPFTVIGVEGVVGGGDDDLTVNGQGEDIVIVMRPYRLMPLGSVRWVYKDNFPVSL